MEKSAGGIVFLQKDTWKTALSHKALHFHSAFPGNSTAGYKIIWWLWSADVFYWHMPLLKSLVCANILVWVLLAHLM